MSDGKQGGQVTIAGAGPVGLWLASELRLAGVDTVVIERLAERSPHQKALGVHPRTVEVLAMRGMAKQFLAEGRQVPSWHFGMLASQLDFRVLDTPFPFMLAYPQVRTEALLEQHALELGVRIVRGHNITGLTQDDESVTVEVTGPDGPYTMSARFVVGCDGPGSAVRQTAGIGFPGTPATVYGFSGDVALDSPPERMGVNQVNTQGTLIIAPLPGGHYRVSGYDPLNQDPSVPLTMPELRATATRIAGTDFGMHDPIWLTKFGNATHVAETYRKGRVLVAGDAAHVSFPAGGVGLNVGVQDAMNLGWKLAAEVQGRARPGLLDSYHAERHPLGEALAQYTLAQTALITTSSPEGLALRAMLSDAIATQPAFALSLSTKLSALDVSYPSPDPAAHPLTGTRVVDRDGTRFDWLHSGRPILLNLSGGPLPTAAGQAAALGIDTHRDSQASPDPGWSGVGAVIVRPDGYVWWATETAPQAELDARVREAVSGLFQEP
jgi:2-polyprenyl-6-methoxyphenol hydroxylase-like FAD-dependent oxidoreductase